MKKLKIEFWYAVFWFGTFLEHLGERLDEKGLSKLEDLTRDDPKAEQYQKKRGMVL